jgi:hypothetical protein
MTQPTESDMKYYRLLQAWHVREASDFEFVNSHEKTAAVRDTSMRETLRSALAARLRNSKNMILIIGSTTKEDRDWIPFEISYAVDECKIPIIAAYPTYGAITAAPTHMWPNALATRIANARARVIHVPFKEKPLTAAVNQFDVHRLPTWPSTYYTAEVYRAWGIESRPPWLDIFDP